jgi:hypothetical protein
MYTLLIFNQPIFCRRLLQVFSKRGLAYHSGILEPKMTESDIPGTTNLIRIYGEVQ